MNKIGFLISEKENEFRRALVIEDIKKIEEEKRKYLYFQTSYGDKIGFTDKDLKDLGCNVVSKKEVMECDVICDPKIRR